jgi:hypothetical protein
LPWTTIYLGIRDLRLRMSKAAVAQQQLPINWSGHVANHKVSSVRGGQAGWAS